MDRDEWLDEHEAAAWRGLWAMSHLVFDRVGRELQARSGLSLFEYDILVRLAATDDHRCRLSELAEATLSSRARLSYHVKRMTQQGLVRREECETDRRGAFAILTGEGLNALREAAPGHVADVREYLLEALDPGQRAALAEIADAVEAHIARTDSAG